MKIDRYRLRKTDRGALVNQCQPMYIEEYPHPALVNQYQPGAVPQSEVLKISF